MAHIDLHLTPEGYFCCQKITLEGGIALHTLPAELQRRNRTSWMTRASGVEPS